MPKYKLKFKTLKLRAQKPPVESGLRYEQVWMEDMERWGKQVHKDILRLEVKTGIVKGDPGDPPPPRR